jgi:hypothetical protein
MNNQRISLEEYSSGDIERTKALYDRFLKSLKRRFPRTFNIDYIWHPNPKTERYMRRYARRAKKS